MDGGEKFGEEGIGVGEGESDLKHNKKQLKDIKEI